MERLEKELHGFETDSIVVRIQSYYAFYIPQQRAQSHTSLVDSPMSATHVNSYRQTGKRTNLSTLSHVRMSTGFFILNSLHFP